MNQPSKNKPRKFGEHPHRAFQGLETIYIPENMADKIKVGDRVYWDFNNEPSKKEKWHESYKGSNYKFTPTK